MSDENATVQDYTYSKPSQGYQPPHPAWMDRAKQSFIYKKRLIMRYTASLMGTCQLSCWIRGNDNDDDEAQ